MIELLKTQYWKAVELKKLAVRQVGKVVRPYLCRLEQRGNRDFFAVRIDARVGFFAQLNWCLYIFSYCDRNGLVPLIELTSPYYTVREGDNWLEYFFTERMESRTGAQGGENGPVTFSRIEELEELGLPRQLIEEMNIPYARYLFDKYLAIRPEITEYVDSFVRQKIGAGPVLGLHYRGTDKTAEAEKVPWDRCLRAVCDYLEGNSRISCLFVASDEEQFIQYLRSKVRGVEVVTHDDILRSSDGRAVHTNRSGNNLVKGHEALVNSLILSRCDVLIKTASFLSGWSKVFNPDLPVRLLNPPYAGKLWFPDRELASTAGGADSAELRGGGMPA